MADLKISQFANGGPIEPGDEIATNRGGVNTKVFAGSAAAADIGTGPDDVPTNDDIAVNVANILMGVSTTSNSIGLGAKSFTTDPDKSFAPGRSLLITSNGSPTTRRMSGIVTAYNSTSGALDITINSITGSGTFTDWTIRVSGEKGEQGVPGMDGTGTVNSVNGETANSSGDVTLLAENVPATLDSGTVFTGADVQAIIDEIDDLFGGDFQAQDNDWTGAQYSTPVSVAYASTVTLNLAAGNNFSIGTLTGAIILANPTNQRPGQSGAIRLVQDGSGNKTITWGTEWRFVNNGTHPLLSTQASAIDYLFYYVGAAGEIACSLNKRFA